MSDTDFKKLDGSDELLPGNRQIILCGMKIKEQEQIRKILKKCHLSADIVYPTEEYEDDTMQEINTLSADTGKGEVSSLNRAIITAGTTQKEFQRFLDRVNKSTLKRSLWATLTETTKEWTLSKLLNELARERTVMG